MQSTPDPGQEKRVLMAVALSVLVLWVFQSFVFEPPPPRPLPEEAATSAPSSDTASASDATPSGEAGAAITSADDGDSARAAPSASAVPELSPIEPELIERS